MPGGGGRGGPHAEEEEEEEEEETGGGFGLLLLLLLVTCGIAPLWSNRTVGMSMGDATVPGGTTGGGGVFSTRLGCSWTCCCLG